MNITICSVAVVFLLSSIFMMFLKDEKLFANFMNTLNEDQKDIYFKIIRERTMLYIGGMLLGLYVYEKDLYVIIFFGYCFLYFDWC